MTSKETRLARTDSAARWKLVVTPRSIDLARLGLDSQLMEAGYIIERVSGGPLTSAALARAWADADAAILGLDTADADAINAAKSLKVIARYGVGYDAVDVDAASDAGIVVTITPDAPSVAVAEYTLALILALIRRLPAYTSTAFAVPASPPEEFAALALGLVGLGRIGRLVAQRAHALGMKVVYFDPYAPSPGEWATGTDLDSLLSSADVVTLHVPLLPQTRHMLGDREFGLMQSSAYLINTARGALVDERSLASALAAGEIAGAALDVRETENSAEPDVLQGVPNLLLTPHVASRTVQSAELMAREAVASVIAVKNGEIPASAVNGDSVMRLGTTERRPPAG
jgi:phosphoglycerate dehydrogenase-like enzyme